MKHIHHVIDESKLTKQERKVLKFSADFCRAYFKLPKQHICDIDEFVRAIHTCQYLIAVRGIRIPEKQIKKTIKV